MSRHLILALPATASESLKAKRDLHMEKLAANVLAAPREWDRLRQEAESLWQGEIART